MAQVFNEVRRLGNAANHALAGDHRTALSGLKLTWQLGLWFHRIFQDPLREVGVWGARRVLHSNEIRYINLFFT